MPQILAGEELVMVVSQVFRRWLAGACGSAILLVVTSGGLGGRALGQDVPRPGLPGAPGGIGAVNINSGV
ncbi:MAG: hypothetical protein ACKOJF_11535 [Planctomycetaceae bacterium]